MAKKILTWFTSFIMHRRREALILVAIFVADRLGWLPRLARSTDAFQASSVFTGRTPVPELALLTMLTLALVLTDFIRSRSDESKS